MINIDSCRFVAVDFCLVFLSPCFFVSCRIAQLGKCPMGAEQVVWTAQQAVTEDQATHHVYNAH